MGQEPGRIVSRMGTVGEGGKAVLKSWKQEKVGKKFTTMYHILQGTKI